MGEDNKKYVLVCFAFDPDTLIVPEISDQFSDCPMAVCFLPYLPCEIGEAVEIFKKVAPELNVTLNKRTNGTDRIMVHGRLSREQWLEIAGILYKRLTIQAVAEIQRRAANTMYRVTAETAELAQNVAAWHTPILNTLDGNPRAGGLRMKEDDKINNNGECVLDQGGNQIGHARP